MNINSISCGQGAPSIYLIVAAGSGVFPADIVVVADTGDENDMLWSTGKRTTAKEFFQAVTKPLAEEFGLESAFVRTQDKKGVPLPDIHLDQRLNGKVEIDLPMFGSRGGRLHQSCTNKYKTRAIRQELKRCGAKTATSNLGITMDEVERIRPNKDVKWETLAWPLVMIEKLYRVTIIKRLEEMNIPYLISSECDRCPHKDWPRWERTSPETIQDVAKWESQFNGDYFLTEYRIPLLEAIELMKSRQPLGLPDICGGVCFT